MSEQPPRLGEYLRRGPVQTRLLHKMATGHAFERHAKQRGITPDAHMTEIRAHLAASQLGFEVIESDGKPHYLVADLKANRVAWVVPHREHRSTFFAPDDSVPDYIRYRQVHKPQDRWRTVDLRAERARAQTTQRIMSASRSAPGRAGPER